MPDPSLYVPVFNRMPGEEIRGCVATTTAQLVTVGPDGIPAATFLPTAEHGSADPDGLVEL